MTQVHTRVCNCTTGRFGEKWHRVTLRPGVIELVTHSWMRRFWCWALGPYSISDCPLRNIENCTNASFLKISSIFSTKDQGKFKHATTASMMWVRCSVMWHLHDADARPFQRRRGWKPADLPAACCPWGCSSSCFSCGCCSDRCHPDTTIHTGGYTTLIQHWGFQKKKRTKWTDSIGDINVTDHILMMPACHRCSRSTDHKWADYQPRGHQ